MSNKTHIVIPDSHAHPQHHNDRAIWLGKLIQDVKPDVVVHIGDSADMPSLSGYDKGTKSFQGRRYADDINSHLDFQDKLWSTVKKAKKRLPYKLFFHGNHEQRIERAIQQSPELDGTIGYQDLKIKDYYDDEFPYNGNTPSVYEVDGITYGHYAVTGVSGRPISGEHLAHSLLVKHHQSVTVGHNHTLDFTVRHTLLGTPIMGLCCGCFIDYESDWAGEMQKMWWRGVVVKRNVSDGVYDPQFISIDALRKEYG